LGRPVKAFYADAETDTERVGMHERKKTGRPLKPAEAGTRVSLGLKVTGEMKNLIDAAAAKSGRSQSQEAAFRLERSFDRIELLPEVLALAYGRELAGLILALAATMDAAGDASPRMPVTANARTYADAEMAAVALLAELRPPGDADAAEPDQWPQQLAGSVAAAIRGEKGGEHFADVGAAVRKLWGLAEPKRTRGRK
jgi:hypothetical protein